MVWRNRVRQSSTCTCFLNIALDMQPGVHILLWRGEIKAVQAWLAELRPHSLAYLVIDAPIAGGNK